MYFLRRIFKVLSYNVFWERYAEKIQQFFKLKNNRLNDCDFNIDPNNRDYDFSRNRAVLGSAQVFWFVLRRVESRDLKKHALEKLITNQMIER